MDEQHNYRVQLTDEISIELKTEVEKHPGSRPEWTTVVFTWMIIPHGTNFNPSTQEHIYENVPNDILDEFIQQLVSAAQFSTLKAVSDAMRLAAIHA